MTRRCSHCSHNGHNLRTCPNRGVKLFGVRLTDGSIRKSASMGNLSHYSGAGENPEPAAPAAEGYASEDFAHGSCSSASRDRKRGKIFLLLHLLSVFNLLSFAYYYPFGDLEYLGESCYACALISWFFYGPKRESFWFV